MTEQAAEGCDWALHRGSSVTSGPPAGDRLSADTLAMHKGAASALQPCCAATFDLARSAHPPRPQAVPLLHEDPERARSRQGVPGTARGTDLRPRLGHLRTLVPRPAQGHPPMGPAAARRPREHPPARARHERRERQDGAHQEHRRARPTTPQQPARRLSRCRARRRIPVPRGLRQAHSRVPMRAPCVPLAITRRGEPT
jgi:hypothetical protein